MKLRLNFLNNNFILINVFDENTAWFKFFQNLKNNNQYFPTVSTKSICYHIHKLDISYATRLKDLLVNFLKNDNKPISVFSKLNTSHITRLEDAWLNIKQNTEYLKSQNFKIPYELPEEFNYDQQLLNTIHRFFTYNSTWALSGCQYDMSGDTPFNCLDISNPFDESFVLKDLKSFFTAINNLNVAVHDLEMTCTTINKEEVLQIIKGNEMFVIDVKNHHNFTNDGWFGIGDTLDEFQKSYVVNYPNVVLSEEIQGKSYLRAFIDNDDPTKQDITGRHGSYGGFFIDAHQHRKEIYKSQKFNDWLESYGLKKENLLLEFPLGQVIDSSMLLTDLDAGEFISIDFIDD
jgi:hypothetical protein